MFKRPNTVSVGGSAKGSGADKRVEIGLKVIDIGFQYRMRRRWPVVPEEPNGDDNNNNN